MMKTVNEVSQLTGVSIRTLHHYDAIGLLKPTSVTEAGYRLYDDKALERLQQILLFRELEFPLKEIQAILESPQFDRSKALEHQIALLTLKKEHLESLIDFAHELKSIGSNPMRFTAFSTKNIDEYAAKAKAAYKQTAEYQEFEEKSKLYTKDKTQKLSIKMTAIFTEFGILRKLPLPSREVQAQVKKLQDFITRYFYTCSNEVLYRLGVMYAKDSGFKETINKIGGEGTAEFVCQAIQTYCEK